MDDERPAIETREWLSPYVPRFRVAGTRLLDIGCGRGFDSAFLCGEGFRMTGFDRDLSSLRAARGRAPAARLFLADVSRALPLRSASFDLALASLSLHYLPRDATRAALAEVRRVLRPGGLFLLRVNASDDYKFGAGDGEELEPGVYRQTSEHGGARIKRFFDEAAVRDAVEGLFAIEELAHRTTYRWGPPKETWQCLARAD